MPKIIQQKKKRKKNEIKKMQPDNENYIHTHMHKEEVRALWQNFQDLRCTKIE